MCGISVIVDRACSAEANARLLRMHAEIRHRGPDGERFVTIGPDGLARPAREPAEVSLAPLQVGMAFRRLQVIDLSEEASQPMSSADGRLWVAFNGEIYNFRELRERLITRGRQFRTHGDTEVVLAAYEEWGTGCFERLDGMWAIVVTDLRRRVVVASRDRFGIKPLHWCQDGPRILLASEAKQILAARDRKPRPNEALVATYLRGNRIPVLDETFFEEIQSLPQATFVEIPLDGDQPLSPPSVFWDFASIEPATLSRRDYPRCVDELEERLRRAVDSHSVADVPVGSLLSGGLDSSMLTAMMAREASERGIAPAPAFTFGFRGRGESVSELPFAEAVAKQYQLALHEATFDEAWIGKHAGRVMRAVEEPVLGMPALAQFRVFERAREEGMTVVIDGEASDEVLAGYPGYQIARMRDLLAGGHPIGFTRELRAIAAYQGMSSAALVRDLVSRRFVQRRTGAYDWIEPSYGNSGSLRQSAIHQARLEHGRRTSRVSRMLFRDVKWGNVKIILGYTDRMSMASSIEARIPYLDLEIVKLAFSLPDDFKTGAGQRKRILRDVARRYLPPEITERRDRMGFGTPDLLFLREGMLADVRERVRSIAGGSMFVRANLERFLTGFIEGRHSDARAIWRLYALARWAEEFQIAL